MEVGGWMWWEKMTGYWRVEREVHLSRRGEKKEVYVGWEREVR
jgi:hypothetical protein